MARLTLFNAAFGQYRLWMRINRLYWVANTFFGLGIPLAFQGVLSHVVGEERGRTRLLIGNAVVGAMMVTLRKTCLTISIDREMHYRELVATTGVSRRAYLLASFFDAATISLLPLSLLCLGPLVLPGVDPPASFAYLPLFVLLIVLLYATAISLASIPMSIPGIQILVNLVMMGTLALCPILYPLERVPGLFREVIGVLPPSLAVELLAASWSGVAIPGWELATLVAWTVALLALGIRRFPWTDTP